MADYDGSIVINTEIDASGFEKGTKELTSAIKSLERQIELLGNRIESAFAGVQVVVMGTADSMNVAAGSANNLGKEVQKAAKSVDTSQYKRLEEQIDAADERALALHQEQEAMKKTGVPEEQWRALDAAIAQAEDDARKLWELQQKLNGKETTEEVTVDTEQGEQRVMSLGERLRNLGAVAKNAADKMLDAFKMSDTSIDGADASAEELKQDLNALGAELEDLSPEEFKQLDAQFKTLEKDVKQLDALEKSAANGGEEEQQAYRAQLEKTEAEYAELERDVQRFAKTKIPTEQYKTLCAEVKNAEKAYLQLLNKQERMQDTGVKENSKAWKNLQYDIDNALANLERYESAQQQMETSGKAYKTGIDTKSYTELASRLQLVKEKLAKFQASENKARTAAQMLAGVLRGGLYTAFAKIANAAAKAAKAIAQIAARKILSGIGTLGKSILSTAKGFLSFGKSADSGNISMKKMLTTILKYAFGIQTLFILFNKLRSAIQDGFSELAQYDSGFNDAMTSITSALSRFKYSLSTAFAPIVTAVAPYVTYLINLLTKAVNVIGQFFAALTGNTTYTQVADTVTDYASSQSDAADATEDATDASEEQEKQLAGFDKLNVLNDTSSDSSSSDSGSDSSSSDSGVTYETVDIASSIQEFADSLVEAWEDGDFEAVGEIIAEKINSAFQKAYDLISWDNVGDKITEAVNGICTVFNSLVDNIDWELIGRTFGAGINTILNTVDLLLTGIDWENLGKSIADALNGLVDEVDWALLGDTIGDCFTAWTELIQGFVLEFDFSGLGTGIATTMNNALDKIDDAILGFDFEGAAKNIVSGFNSAVDTLNWDKLGQTISDAVEGALTFAGTALEEVDWWNLGSSIKEMIVNIDWNAIADALFEAIGAAIGGIAAFLGGLLSDAFASMYDYFADSIEDCGGNIVAGIFTGIKNAIVSIATWIKTHIVEPFIEGFKTAFGISSPSTVMMEYGEYIIEGVLQGILSVITNIGTWIKENVLEPIGNALSTFSGVISIGLEKAEEWAEEAWTALCYAGQTVLSTVQTALQKASTWVADAWTALGYAGQTVVSTVQTALQKASSWVADAWTVISSAGKTLVTTIQNKLQKHSTWNSDAWTAIKDVGSTLVNTIQNKLQKHNTWNSDAWTAIRNVGSTLVNTIQNKLQKHNTWNSDAWTAIRNVGSTLINTIQNKLQKHSTWNSDAWTALKNVGKTLTLTVQTVLKKASTWVANAWTAISNAGKTLTDTVETKLKKGSTFNSDALYCIKNAASKTITFTVNVAARLASAVRALLGLRSGGVIVNGKVTTFASGGRINRRGIAQYWDAIPKYAGGTASAHGTVFVAGEAGPEVVGHIGGRTEVLNKSQLAETMYTAVVNGIGDAINAFWSLLSNKMAECANAVIASMEYLLTLPQENEAVAIMSALDGIAESATFTVPVMATGTVTPYATNEAATADEMQEIISDAGDSLAVSLIAAMSSASGNIVEAIKTYSNSGGTLDESALATSIIEEINRRTRMRGTSPLVGVS